MASDGETVATFSALNIALNHFENYSKDERTLGALIANSIAGQSTARLRVDASIDFGVAGALEVFSSQNYVEGKAKPRGFAQPLYYVHSSRIGKAAADRQSVEIRVMGQAALRDQKVSNALRTIDTWYNDFDDHGQIIAVEPNGANLGRPAFLPQQGLVGVQHCPVA